MHDEQIETTRLPKKYINDENIQLQSGKFFTIENDWTQINKDSHKNISKIIIYKPDNGGILAILYKNAISSELCKIAVEKYMKAGKMVSTNRGNAAGSQHRNTKVDSLRRYEKGIASNSTIIGYIDSSNHKRPCRLTSFSRDYYKDYKDGLKFINAIDNCFKTSLPDMHSVQYNALKNNAADFQIEDTAFSTVTVNYNFQTALHRDSGDFKDGFGNLVVCQKDIEGGEILFPQYKLSIQLNTGDFLAMDVHEWHCNNTIRYINDTGYRLSFVCYYREKMSQCNTINKNILNVTGNLDGKSWDTEIIFHKIFTALGFNEVPLKTIIEEGKPWWKIDTNNITLTYRYKRYILHDKKNNKTIHNLLPAYNYIIQIIKTNIQNE
jgi:hypothetical protein